MLGFWEFGDFRGELGVVLVGIWVGYGGFIFGAIWCPF